MPNNAEKANTLARISELEILQESISTGSRPYRFDKDDEELFSQHWRDAAIALDVPARFTDSDMIVRRAFWGRNLHAAILLVERILPDWAWSLEKDNDVDDSHAYWCDLIPSALMSLGYTDKTIRASGDSPTIAVLSALVSERMSTYQSSSFYGVADEPDD